MPSTSPQRVRPQQVLPEHGDYLAAVAEALREEYLAIVEAGYLQVDARR